MTNQIKDLFYSKGVLRDPVTLLRDFTALAASGLSLVFGILVTNYAFGADTFSKDKHEITQVQAAGVQIYECKPDEAGAWKWQFREPLATLMKDGKTVGRHFAGPSWELASGGVIVGKVQSQAPGETEEDIALLELSVVDRHGEGVLTTATTVQRLDTKGGVFGGACDKPGELHLEPYTADYVFLN